MNLFKVKLPSINSTVLPWGVALYLALVLNFPLILKVYDFIHVKETALTSLLYLIPFIIFLCTISISLICLLSFKYLEKPIYIGLTLLCSILNYAYIFYGVVFSDDSPLIGVIEQTSIREVWPLLTPSFYIWFFIFGILPSYVIYKVNITRPVLWKEFLIKTLSVLLYPLFYLATLLPSMPTYAPVLLLSGLAARPPYQIIPTNFAENVFYHVQTKYKVKLPYKALGLDATRTQHQINTKHELLVIAIGETARSSNFELNDYPRKTNKYTIKQHMISFKNFSSCSTTTRVSVPCIFSSLSRHQYFTPLAKNQDNLLDILKRVGLDLYWVDNNGNGGCQGVCKHIEAKVIDGLDEQLINELRQHIKQSHDKDTVIVLHLHGSHGPNYFDKYPENFGDFKPDCRKFEFRLCDKEALFNAYDNSILYTDYVLNELIKVLKSENKTRNTALLYTSDHGESIGEGGLYGHCAPYIIAPKEQTQVPFLVWMSAGFKSTKHISPACLQTKANQGDFSHDNLFHSILGIMDVKTTVYQERLDLFKSCRQDIA